MADLKKDQDTSSESLDYNYCRQYVSHLYEENTSAKYAKGLYLLKKTASEFLLNPNGLIDTSLYGKGYYDYIFGRFPNIHNILQKLIVDMNEEEIQERELRGF